MSTSPVDPHLPAVHLRPPRNWINDPNGLVFHDGHYHVFFQYNPYGPHHANMHWGHYRSPDLLTWHPLPVALAPTPDGHDADGCFSGNAVSADGRLLAFYSAHRNDRWWQPVTSAESPDGGRTWTKRPDLLIPEPPAGTTMYRDPYVWREGGAGPWRMLVGAALEDGRAAALLYESEDLEGWEYQGPFCVSGAVDGGGSAGSEVGAGGPAGSGPDAGGPVGWECPQYATFGDRGVLIVSDWTPKDGPRAVSVLTGREEDGRFSAAGPPVPLDYGPDFYAPALLKAPGEDRWLLWGWSWEARDADWSDEAGWAGTLTWPREVTLTDDGTVRQRPARELLALRGERVVRRAGWVGAGDGVAVGEVGRTFEVAVTLTGGAFGSSGSSGTSGSSGSSGSSGELGVSGSSGTSGLSGTAGSSGELGASGSSGTSGSADTSGSSSAFGSSTTFGLRLVTSADGAEYLDFRLDSEAGHLVVDRSHASLDARARAGAYTVPCPEAAVPGAAVELRIVVDRSIAEVYLPDGQAATLRFYPTGEGPWRLETRAGGGGGANYTVEAWELRSGGIRHELAAELEEEGV